MPPPHKIRRERKRFLILNFLKKPDFTRLTRSLEIRREIEKMVFQQTNRTNICFGKPDVSEREMIEAAKKARCHEFIMALPDGYDTVIGEGGSTLSGGEKQRISLARAILKDAPVIILDEATASIDPENEHLIQEAISELTRGKTIITIAHRLATIEEADQILVVEDGQIVQRGTHKELLQEKGRYQNFVKVRKRAEGWKIA